MSRSEIYASFAHSFLWIVLFAVAAIAVSSNIHLVLFAIMHGNRTHQDVVSLMVAQTPMIALVTSIGSLLIFTLPQAFQAALVAVLHRAGRSRFAVLPALPLTAVATWYCYDYLTIDFTLGINAGPDWTPYQHGISISRYMKALAFQTPITLFSLLFIDAKFRGVGRNGWGRVVRRIQAHAQETYTAREVVVAPHAVAQRGERRVREGTAQRIGAVGVKKCQQRDLALCQRREPDCPARAVEQNGVGDALDVLQGVAARWQRHELQARCGGLARIFSRETRARAHEEAVGVTVVATCELDHPVAVREPAREPHSRHRGLGSRRGHAFAPPVGSRSRANG